MTINITPTSYVQVPLDGTGTLLSIIVNPFPLFPTEINVTWTVTGEGLVKTGVMTLPQSLINAWGVDDTIVKDYILQQLNLIEA